VIPEAQGDGATILRGYTNDVVGVACAATSTGQVIRSICDSTPSATNNETATNITYIDKDEEILQKRQRAAEYMRQYRNRKATNITHIDDDEKNITETTTNIRGL
jgi:hypothetical protein